MKILTLIDKAFLLKKCRLFSELDLDLLLAIADKLGLAHYQTGSEIFKAGDEAHRMFLIVEGSVVVHDPQGRQLATLHTEDFFGDEALFNDKARAYSAASQSDTVLLTLSQMHLLSIISECPAVAIGLLAVYASSVEFRKR